jgi:hypothetical protein
MTKKHFPGDGESEWLCDGDEWVVEPPDDPDDDFLPVSFDMYPARQDSASLNGRRG